MRIVATSVFIIFFLLVVLNASKVLNMQLALFLADTKIHRRERSAGRNKSWQLIFLVRTSNEYELTG